MEKIDISSQGSHRGKDANRSRGLSTGSDVDAALEEIVQLPQLKSGWEQSSSGVTAHELESRLGGPEQETPPYSGLIPQGGSGKAPHCPSAPMK